MGFPDMVVAAEVIDDAFPANGADLHVLHQVVPKRRLLGQLVHGEKRAVVQGGQGRADGIVRIQDQVGGRIDAGLHQIRDVFGMGVAAHGIPEEVRDDEMVRFQDREQLGGAALVHFQYAQLFPAFPAEGRSRDEGGGCPGVDIGALPVGHRVYAHGFKDIAQHIADRGFPVGAGDADQGLRTPDPRQEIRADPQGDLSGSSSAALADDAAGQLCGFRAPECEIKRQLFHSCDSFPNSLNSITAG